MNTVTLEYGMRPIDRAMMLIGNLGTQLLGAHDGCSCTNFSVCGFSVDINCRRSGDAGIVLTVSDPGNTPHWMFEEMGREIQRQIKEWPGDMLRLKIMLPEGEMKLGEETFPA